MRPQGDGAPPVELTEMVDALGAGEVFLTSFEHDSAKVGYDVDFIRDVAAVANVPVIASGVCGNYGHMADVLSSTRAAAFATASILHFTGQAPREAKNLLVEYGFQVKL